MASRTRARTVTIACSRTIAVSPKAVFAFLDAPANMNRAAPISPPISMKKFPTDLRPGSTFGYGLEQWPLKIEWETVVSEYRPPLHVLSVQSRGYFPRWEHSFDLAECPQGCEVSTRLEYEYPAGLYASLANQHIIARAMEALVACQLAGLSGAFSKFPTGD